MTVEKKIPFASLLAIINGLEKEMENHTEKYNEELKNTLENLKECRSWGLSYTVKIQYEKSEFEYKD